MKSKLLIIEFAFLILMILATGCKNTSKDSLVFNMSLGELDNQSVVPILEGNMNFTKTPDETLINLPKDLDNIQFASIHTSFGSDSLATVISGVNHLGDVQYILDCDNDEDFGNDDVLTFKKGDKIWIANEILSNKEGDRSPLIVDPTCLTFIQRRPGKLEYHYNELWETQIQCGSESLDVKIQRFAPASAFLFIDVNQSGSYERILFPKTESLALNGVPYHVEVDFSNSLVHLKKTDQNPVDKGWPAPPFEEKVWNTNLSISVGQHGKDNTLLVFWSPLCQGSNHEAGEFHQLKKDLGEIADEIRFIAVTQSEAALISYLSKKEYDYMHLISDELWKMYAVTAPFASFIIDQNGIIQERYFGFDEKLKKDLISLVNQP